MGKTIGETNGPWAVLLKIALLLVPLLVPWGAWMTREQIRDNAFRLSGERFTQLDGAMMEKRISDRINGLPPDDWRTRILGTETTLVMLDRRLDQIEQQQARIITLLEARP